MDAVLWGATGQAKVLRECLLHSGHVVTAVVDNDPHVTAPWKGALVLRGGDQLARWLVDQAGPVGCVAAVGGPRGRVRLALHEDMVRLGLVPLTVVHPTAFVAASAVLGEGAQILAQAAVAVDARLGRCVIVNTSASVDHDAELGDGVHVGPGAHLAGSVTVGSGAFIGTGAVVVPRTRIGVDAVVGAGAVVLDDVPEGATVVGNPARQLR